MLHPCRNEAFLQLRFAVRVLRVAVRVLGVALKLNSTLVCYTSFVIHSTRLWPLGGTPRQVKLLFLTR